MERNLQRGGQLATMRKNFFDQGYLDDQFILLEELQDDANPNFVEEVVTSFYRESVRIIQNIDQTLLEKNPSDFCKLENYINQFKGSCSSIGAKRVKIECMHFKDDCKAGNKERCIRSFQQLKGEYFTLKKELEAYFQFARQAGPSETACRPN